MTHAEHIARVERLRALIDAAKRGETSDDVAFLVEVYGGLEHAICWEVGCVHEAQALDMIISADRERDRLKRIEAAARAYREAVKHNRETQCLYDVDPSVPHEDLAAARRREYEARTRLDALLATPPGAAGGGGSDG